MRFELTDDKRTNGASVEIISRDCIGVAARPGPWGQPYCDSLTHVPLSPLEAERMAFLKVLENRSNFRETFRKIHGKIVRASATSRMVCSRHNA